MRCRHRRALEEVVAECAVVRAAERLLQDAIAVAVAVLVDGRIAAGRNNVKRRAVIRILRACVVEAGRTDRDHVCIVGGGVTDGSRAVVAGSGDDRDALIEGILERIFECLRAARAAEREVHDFGAVVRRKADTVCNRGVRAAPACIEDFYRHDRCAVGNACGTFGVIRALRHRARDVRAVAVVVIRVHIVVHEIIPGGEGGIREIRRYGIRFSALREIFVRDTGVDDCNRDARAVRSVPRCRDADLREIPLILEVRIIRRHKCVCNIIRLRVFNIGARAESARCLFHPCAALEFFDAERVFALVLHK